MPSSVCYELFYAAGLPERVSGIRASLLRHLQSLLLDNAEPPSKNLDSEFETNKASRMTAQTS